MALWTLDELDQLLLAYGKAFSERDKKLLWFSAAALVLVVLAATVVRSFSAVFLLAPYALAIIFWSRAWHKRYAVRCPHCGASLSAVHEQFEQPREHISSVACHKCKTIVAQGWRSETHENNASSKPEV